MSCGAEAETKLCGACLVSLPKDNNFSKKQWQQKQRRKCKPCTELGKEVDVAGLTAILEKANLNLSGAPNDTNKKATTGKGKAKAGKQKILDVKLEVALKQLKIAGGREDEPDEDNDTEDNPGDYLDELLAVADARYNLKEYSQAASLYYRGYYAAMHKGSCINDPEVFPIAHKMLMAYIKADSESGLQMAHGMAQQTVSMPGHPAYIREDLVEVERIMTRRGMRVERFGMGMGGFGF